MISNEIEFKILECLEKLEKKLEVIENYWQLYHLKELTGFDGYKSSLLSPDEKVAERCKKYLEE